MMTSIAKVKTCTYVLNMDERVYDKPCHAEYIAKVNVDPPKIYVYSVKPNPGAEALYVENANSNKILVNPNRFPFITLSLSVNSMLLRKNHQYNILQMGFSYLYEVLKKNADKNGEKFYSALSVKEDVVYNKKEYHVLEINNPEFGYVTYKVQPGDNVTSIADKHLVNDHMILEINDNISDYYDVKPGQVIRIPNSYARKIVLYLDKNSHLPLVQTIYDDKGLYSRIAFSSFILNPNLPKEEFHRNFPKYKF
jgi:LysM repeat protein